MELIRQDIKFLGAHKLMDYSLLLIIEEYKRWGEMRDAAAKKKAESGLDALGQVEATEILLHRTEVSAKTNQDTTSKLII